MADEMVTTKDGVWRIDVDTFVPKPEGYIKVGGIEYPIYSFLDLPIGASFRIARLAEDLKDSETYEDRVARNVDQILLLNSPAKRAEKPLLTKELFENFTPREILSATVMASTIAGVPLKADVEKSDRSPEPSPASAGSTDGGEGTSSPSA